MAGMRVRFRRLSMGVEMKMAIFGFSVRFGEVLSVISAGGKNFSQLAKPGKDVHYRHRGLFRAGRMQFSLTKMEIYAGFLAESEVW